MNILTGVLCASTIEPEEIADHIGDTITIHGIIHKIRKMSDFAFVLLRTKRLIVQCIHGDSFSDFPLSEMVEESAVVLEARVEKEERSRSGYELRILSVQVLSRPSAPSPIAINGKRVDASLQILLDNRPISLRNERERAIFKLQEGICKGIRDFLHQNSFTEIHSPKLVFAGAEGGANIFRVDYFGRDVFLAQSPQFYKQMMVGVFERVYEIGPVFRAEKHDTSRHLNEYTSVDLEMGFIRDFREIMEMETRLLQHVMGCLREEYPNELRLLEIRLPDCSGIPVLPFAEAKETVALKYGRPITDFHDFEPEEERLLCDFIHKETGSEFVFVTHYPSSTRPFYAMDDPSDSSKTSSFDLLFRGMEITTGGQRIHGYSEQVAKMIARGMDVAAFESYLMIHKYGMPPHGGLGLGLERFTSRLLEQNNVRLSTLFPRDISRVTP
jgi:nondiscriminating aspartyl-tRNA synthetase